MSAPRPTLILQSGDPAGGGSAVWVPAQSAEQVLNASGEHLVFLPGLDHGDVYVRNTLIQEFERRYSPELPGLERLRVVTRSESVPGRNGRSHWSSTLQSVHVRSIEAARVIPDTLGVPEIVAAARQCGVLPVAGSAVADVRALQAQLAAEGCCLRCRAPESEFERKLLERNQSRLYEVRYDPAAVTRRDRLRRTRARHLHSGHYSATGALTVIELIRPVGYHGRRFGTSRSGFEPLLAAYIDGQCAYPWSIRYKRRPARSDALRLWQETITLCNTLYGRNAHRHVPEFRIFLKEVWRSRGAATQRTWLARLQRCGSELRLAQRLFGWLDRECRVRKPRPRDLSRCVARRVEGLFPDFSESPVPRTSPCD
jgi:hypothetical protein